MPADLKGSYFNFIFWAWDTPLCPIRESPALRQLLIEALGPSLFICKSVCSAVLHKHGWVSAWSQGLRNLDNCFFWRWVQLCRLALFEARGG